MGYYPKALIGRQKLETLSRLNNSNCTGYSVRSFAQVFWHIFERVHPFQENNANEIRQSLLTAIACYKYDEFGEIVIQTITMRI